MTENLRLTFRSSSSPRLAWQYPTPRFNTVFDVHQYFDKTTAKCSRSGGLAQFAHTVPPP